MEPGTLPALAAWETFYLIIGPSAAVLLGLQFVVIVLGTEVHPPNSLAEVNAFGTPTVVHFSLVLLESAVFVAPWHRFTLVATTTALLGLGGTVYTLVVTRRARRATGYRPVLEDWVWHIVLPFTAYAVTTISAILLPLFPRPAMFAIAGMAMLLMLDGIHNAWDTVTFMAVEGRKRRERPD